MSSLRFAAKLGLACLFVVSTMALIAVVYSLAAAVLLLVEGTGWVAVLPATMFAVAGAMSALLVYICILGMDFLLPIAMKTWWE